MWWDLTTNSFHLTARIWRSSCALRCLSCSAPGTNELVSGNLRRFRSTPKWSCIVDAFAVIYFLQKIQYTLPSYLPLAGIRIPSFLYFWQYSLAVSAVEEYFAALLLSRRCLLRIGVALTELEDEFGPSVSVSSSVESLVCFRRLLCAVNCVRSRLDDRIGPADWGRRRAAGAMEDVSEDIIRWNTFWGWGTAGVLADDNGSEVVSASISHICSDPSGFAMAALCCHLNV